MEMMIGNKMQALDLDGNILAITIEPKLDDGGGRAPLLKLVRFEGKKPDAFVLTETAAKELQRFLAQVLK